MKKFVKRALCLLLTLCLVFTLLPVNASAASPTITYFNCDVTIQTTRGKTVNLYKNITDSQRYDYFDQGQTAYSTKGAKISDGSTWYQIQAYGWDGKIITVWLNAGSSGVKIINNDKVEPSLSFSPSSLTVDEGDNKTISINYRGDDVYLPAFIVNDDSICSASWGDVDVNTGKAALIVTGKKAGSTSIKINLIDSNRKILYTQSFAVTVNDNRTSLSANPSSINLNLTNKTSQSVTVTLGGSYPSGTSLEWSTSGVAEVTPISDAVRNGQAQVKVYAEEAGSGTVTFMLVGDGKVYATTTINVTVAALMYTVSYNANGGSGAPSSQIKTKDTALTLSLTEPTCSGYTFLGWSASPGSMTPEYYPGYNFYENKDIVLYAVWKKTTSETDITDVASTLTISPTSYPTGTLTVGSYYSLQGDVTSNYKITSIKAEILTSSGGSTGITKTVKPNATSYSLYDSDIDTAMTFNTLSAGTYKLKFTATDDSGKTETWQSGNFTVENKATNLTLKINATAYPKGTLTVGSYYSLQGTVTSNYKITSIKAEILTSSGVSTGITKTVKPNVTSYSLYNSDIDAAMTFNTLSAGTYKLKFIATDDSGKTETWQSGNFTVENKATNSTLKINATAYPKGTLTVGSYYSLQGTVTSNYKITSIKAEILTSSGVSTGITKTVKPNVTSYSLYNSDIDAAMTFNTLSAGTYKLKFIATDDSGKTETWQSGNFTVENKATNSTLKINATAYPKGTLTVGSYYSLQGTVTSNYKITSIKVEILTSSGGSTGNTKTVNPNASSYSFFGSAIDTAMKFNTLSAGTYYLKYTAKDASGKTVSWTSPNFNMKKITVPASSSATVEKAISQMEAWAADDKIGYQWGGWGPEYDCSHAVITAWELAGVKVKSAGAVYTGNMRSVFTRNGFVDVTSSVNQITGAGLKRGDVLLIHHTTGDMSQHTAMYCGNGRMVQASWNYDGVKGDSSGKEFWVGKYNRYYNEAWRTWYNWDYVLRYVGG